MASSVASITAKNSRDMALIGQHLDVPGRRLVARPHSPRGRGRECDPIVTARLEPADPQCGIKAVTPERTFLVRMMVMCPTSTSATSVMASSGPVGRTPIVSLKSRARGQQGCRAENLCQPNQKHVIALVSHGDDRNFKLTARGIGVS
jgi:hypothetical protein